MAKAGIFSDAGFAYDACTAVVALLVCGACGERVVVAYPYEYGGCHHAVVVVSLYRSHLLAVILELIEIQLVCGL